MGNGEPAGIQEGPRGLGPSAVQDICCGGSTNAQGGPRLFHVHQYPSHGAVRDEWKFRAPHTEPHSAGRDGGLGAVVRQSRSPAQDFWPRWGWGRRGELGRDHLVVGLHHWVIGTCYVRLLSWIDSRSVCTYVQVASYPEPGYKSWGCVVIAQLVMVIVCGMKTLLPQSSQIQLCYIFIQICFYGRHVFMDTSTVKRRRRRPLMMTDGCTRETLESSGECQF